MSKPRFLTMTNQRLEIEYTQVEGVSCKRINKKKVLKLVQEELEKVRSI